MYWRRSMRALEYLLALGIILAWSSPAVLAVNLAGTWESKYNFGPGEEVMTAEIQQVGNNLIGSYTVTPSSGDKYSGIIFGSLEGDKVWAYYLAEKRQGGPDASIALAEISIEDSNTLKGTFNYQDTDMIGISAAPFEAHRI
jgi:hypothetical protein